MRMLLALGATLGLCAPALAADPPAKTDRYGDPLPAGALARLGTLRTRAPITGFGIEKDGTVVTVGPNADVRRWHTTDDQTETPIVLPRPEGSVTNNYPQVSPDGKYVAACTNEKIFVWGTPTDANAKPKEVAAFTVGRPRLYRFAPDGSKLAITTEGREISTVHLADLKTGKVTDLEGAVRYYEGINFSGDGKRLVGVGSDRLVLWDVTTGKKLAEYQPEHRSAGRFALNAAGDLLVGRAHSGGDKNDWYFIDPLTGKGRNGFTGPKGGKWATFAPDDKALLVGDDECVRWWDHVTGKLVRKFDGVASGFALQELPAQFSSDGKLLVAHNSHAILRWNAETGKPLFPEQDIGHGAYINGLGVSPDGTRIATRGGNRVCVWDAATGKALWHAPALGSNIPYLNFSPDGKTLYVPGPEWGEVIKHDAETGKEVLKFAVDPKEPKQSRVNSIRISADGRTMFGLSGPVTISDPGLITVWDATTGKRLKTSRLTARAKFGAELSPGAVYLSGGAVGLGPEASAVVDPEKNLLADGKLSGLSMLPGHFSDDGKWLTQARTETAVKGTAVVISTLTWRVVGTAPMTGPGAIALAPDGRTLAVAVGENLEFYDAATGQLLGAQKLPVRDWTRGVFQYTHVLQFTPDGTKLVSGHLDTTALVWSVPARPAK